MADIKVSLTDNSDLIKEAFEDQVEELNAMAGTNNFETAFVSIVKEA